MTCSYSWKDKLSIYRHQSYHFSKETAFENDSPIFYTSKDEITFVCGGVLDQRETEVKRVRWEIFHFHYKITSTKQKFASLPRI